MFNFKNLDRIEAQETEGVWFKSDYGYELKVARYENSSYQAALRKSNKAEIEQIQIDGTITPEYLESFARKEREAAVLHILKDWRGMADDNGELAFSEELARAAMEKEFFYREVIAMSKRYEDFKQVQEKEEEKN